MRLGCAYLVWLAAQAQADLALRVYQAVLKGDHARVEQRVGHLPLDRLVGNAREVVGEVAQQYVALAPMPPPVVGQVALEQLKGVVGAAPLDVGGVRGYERGDYRGHEGVLGQRLLHHALGEVHCTDVAQLAALPQVEADETPAYVAALQKVLARFHGVSQVVLHVPLRRGLPHHATRGLLGSLAQAVEVGHRLKGACLDALGLGPGALLLAALPACGPPLLRVHRRHPARLAMWL